MTKHREKRTPEQTAANIAKLRANFPKYGQNPRQRCITPNDLPPWARRALFRHEYDKATWRSLAKEYGKGESTLRDYAASPGGKAYREIVIARFQQDYPDGTSLGDSTGMAAEMFRAAALGLASDYVAYLEVLKQAGMHAEVAKAMRDMLDRAGVTAKTGAPSQGQVVQININGNSFSLDMPTGESSHEKIEAADFELLPPD